MLYEETKLKGVFNITIDKKSDERGFFARLWDYNEFKNMGLNTNIVQCNVAFTKKCGTLRGLHYQENPNSETKLLRCTKGSIFNVIVDLRKNSPTYLQWDSLIISEDNYKMRYIPKGFANGVMSLEDNTELFYQVTEFYMPDAERGIRWNDPAINIEWPQTPSFISKKDQSWEFLNVK